MYLCMCVCENRVCVCVFVRLPVYLMSCPELDKSVCGVWKHPLEIKGTVEPEVAGGA